MKTSESIKEISKAILKAQIDMDCAKKDATNPYFKSSYADYNSVLMACKYALNENGITVMQPHTFRDGQSFVETVLLHESGEFISSETEIITSKKNDPQALGSAITYARRYSLQSIVSIPSVDDDGEKAMNRFKSKKQAVIFSDINTFTVKEFIDKNNLDIFNTLNTTFKAFNATGKTFDDLTEDMIGYIFQNQQYFVDQFHLNV